MTHLTARKPAPRRGGYLFAVATLLLAAVAACWALTALFPYELHQVWYWLLARFQALTS
ncbi:hypothetical protein ACFPN1_11145 [Lysobacter yangpyeongensis]|jgi:hypothetical protein|uniref:Uncharacterized protein n=1 Tax=Lysobacter yangpyeongensis TaxID=346182 RepID=A0ABW0SPB5_9GAMM